MIVRINTFKRIAYFLNFLISVGVFQIYEFYPSSTMLENRFLLICVCNDFIISELVL